MKKLYRSRTDSKLFGLCGGLAEYLNVDSTLLRVVVLVTAFFSGGTVIPLYFIACLVIPKEPVFEFSSMHQGSGPYYTSPGSGSRPNQPPMGNPYAGNPHMGSPNMGNPYTGSTHHSGPQSGPNTNHGYAGASSHESRIDEMMRELEKKALQKEIEELRAKLAKYEKGGYSGRDGE